MYAPTYGYGPGNSNSPSPFNPNGAPPPPHPPHQQQQQQHQQQQLGQPQQHMMYNPQQYGAGPGQGHPQSQFPGAPGPSMGGNPGAMGMMQNNGMAQMAGGHGMFMLHTERTPNTSSSSFLRRPAYAVVFMLESIQFAPAAYISAVQPAYQVELEAQCLASNHVHHPVPVLPRLEQTYLTSLL